MARFLQCAKSPSGTGLESGNAWPKQQNPAPELCFCFNKTLLEHSLLIYISSREAFVLPTDTVYPGNIKVSTIWHSAEKIQ